MTTANNKLALAELTFIENPYYQPWLQGFKEACDVFGYSYDIHSSGGDINVQLKNLQQATKDGIDMVGGLASTVEGAPEFVKVCQSNQIPVVTVWQIGQWTHPADIGQYHVQHILPNAIREGEIMATALFEKMNASGNFVHIEGLSGSISNWSRNIGIRRVLRRYPDIHQLGNSLSGNWTKEAGREKMETFLSNHGGQIDAVLAQNDSMALGSLNVLENQGISIPVSGCDAIAKGVKAVKQERLSFTITNHLSWQGGWTVVRCHDWYNGWRPRVPERIMLTGQQLITQGGDNYSDVSKTIPAGAYYKKMFGDDCTPYDWKLTSETEGDDWDPQNQLQPVGQKDMQHLLRWTESNRPDGYSLPEGYSESNINFVEKKYSDAFQRDPLNS